MRSHAIAVRIDDYMVDLVNKIIKYKFANSKADALRWLMQNGMRSAKEVVQRKERTEVIIKKWKENGLPDLPSNLSEVSIKDRD